MSTLTIVLLVILVVLIIACVVLYFLGKRAEKKQAEQQEQLDAVAQTISMLIIDKGKVRMKDADFPPIVLQSQSRAKDHDPDVRCPDLSADPGKKRSKSHCQRYLHNRSKRNPRAVSRAGAEKRLLRKTT